MKIFIFLYLLLIFKKYMHVRMKGKEREWKIQVTLRVFPVQFKHDNDGDSRAKS